MTANKQTAAKQKAVEIVEKYLKCTFKDYEGTTETFDMEEAKQCALIAVEYILKSCPTEPSKDGFSFSQTVAHTTNFWQQVRSEIEKL